MTASETTFNKSDINKDVYKFSDVNKVVYKFLAASSAKLVDDLNKPCELNLLTAFADLLQVVRFLRACVPQFYLFSTKCQCVINNISYFLRLLTSICAAWKQ